MSMTITVSEEIARHLDSLPLGGDDVEDKIRALLEAEYRRRLTRYSLTDQQLQKKYSMSFEEFERRHIVRERGYTWEVESDTMNWEIAIDGIQTMSKRLAELLGRDQR